MAAIDAVVLLTPVLMLAVAMLLVFVGCDKVFSVPTTTLNIQATPGIPPPNTRITPVDLTWNTNANT